MELSKEELIQKVIPGGGHLVIVGAGASYSLASTHGGDKNGKTLPLMKDLVHVTGASSILKKLGYKGKVDDFEAVYSQLAEKLPVKKLQPLNEVIANYFADIEIPDDLTNYDYLLAGLRPRDFVATFNWDPLIVQSYERLIRCGLRQFLPKVLFLHGNVAIGYCSADGVSGPLKYACPRCGKKLTPTPLLYPVAEKDYASNEFIKAQWDTLKRYMGYARVVSIYGYSAPVTDKAAVTLLQEGWGKNTDREFEQFELIIRPKGDEQAARRAWDTFIHTHHYHVVDDIMKSYIGRVPRRAMELWWEQNLEAKFVEDNPYPKLGSVDELSKWVQPLIAAEQEYAINHKSGKSVHSNEPAT